MASCSGSLVRLCCREQGTLQIHVTGLCGEHSQCSGHTRFAPARGVCFPRLPCSGSRLLYRERALGCVRLQFSGTPQKRRLGWSCVLCLPHPSSQELDERTLPGCSAPYPLCGPHLSFHVHISRVHLVSVLGSWPLAPTLPADVNHPAYRKVFG